MKMLRNLCCEHLEKPLGIGTPHPRFSWVIDDPERNSRQSTYHVQVGKSSNFDDGQLSLLWDSGKIESDVQHEIRYTGDPLSTCHRYYWRVRIWTESGQDSGWSESTSFETGFFSISDWDSEWISYHWNMVNQGERTVNHARREFAIGDQKKVMRARLYVASTSGSFFDDMLRMNLYEVRINGRKVSDDLYNPGQLSDRRGRALYRTYDIGAWITPGANAIGLVYLSAKISAQVKIEYSDGTQDTINTDTDWRWLLKGPYTQLWRIDVDEFGGKSEIYDARNEYTGWDQSHFDDSGWHPAHIASPAEILAPQMQSVHPAKFMPPLSIIKKETGRYIVDFGCVFNGIETIRIKGPAGTTVTLKFSESVWENGEINPTSTLSWRNTADSIHLDRYIKKCDEVEEYTPHFSMHSFRYIEVSGYAGELESADIWAWFVHSPVTNGSEFATSDERVQRLQTISVRTMLSSLNSVPMDGPSRERQAWLGDAGVCLSRVECANFDLRLFYEKWFNDIADSQESSGFLPFISPWRINGVIASDVPWSTGFCVALWEAYMAYGDKTFLTKYYNIAKKWTQYLDSLPLREGLSHGHARFNDHLAEFYISLDYIENVYSCHSYDLVSRMAAELGELNDASHCRAKAQERRAAINHHFLKNDGVYVDDKNIQSTNTLALYYGIVPESRREQVEKRLFESIVSAGHLTTGILGAFCLPMLLGELNRNDIMWQIIHWDTPRTWGSWLKDDSTTSVPENWIKEPEKLGTFNHPALIGGLGAWFYRELAGIKPLLPGYKKSRIKPYIPSNLNSAEATIVTVHGPLTSSWKKENAQLTIAITIPANTSAELHLPTNHTDSIRETMGVVHDASGVYFLRHEDNGVVFAIGSGNYQFHLPISNSA